MNNRCPGSHKIPTAERLDTEVHKMFGTCPVCGQEVELTRWHFTKVHKENN